MEELSTLTRTQIEARFKISGKAGKEGTTFIAKGNDGKKYAIKLFKSTKSSAKIIKEAELQQLAARYGVAPAVHHVSTIQKFIVMDALEETIVDKGRRDNWKQFPREYAAQLYALCNRLDDAKVLQNDGNPLNLMLDKNGRMYIIDYGMAKMIDKKVLKKRGSQPNVNLTLWGFSRQLRHYGFANDLQKDIVDEYMLNNSFKDTALLEEAAKAAQKRTTTVKTAKRTTTVKTAKRAAVKTAKRTAVKTAKRTAVKTAKRTVPRKSQPSRKRQHPSTKGLAHKPVYKQLVVSREQPVSCDEQPVSRDQLIAKIKKRMRRHK